MCAFSVLVSYIKNKYARLSECTASHDALSRSGAQLLCPFKSVLNTILLCARMIHPCHAFYSSSYPVRISSFLVESQMVDILGW